MNKALVAALAVLMPAGCGGEPGPISGTSGVRGTVHLGPQCPVEQEGVSCEDQPAAGVTVAISEQLPGEAYAAGPVVARGTTDDEGRFRVSVPPGEYVVTADAGMSCELMDVRVANGTFSRVDVPCDTGIR